MTLLTSTPFLSATEAVSAKRHLCMLTFSWPTRAAPPSPQNDAGIGGECPAGPV